ncbi:MAG: MBOAT family protein [Phycisphaeraceae bacterium]|nr:MBOAT family protein [Phycisphaeraceae bacterium]
MLFNTWEFGFFFLVVFLLYHLLGMRGQNVLLLMASYIFYGAWDWRFLSLLWISTVVDYTVALFMPSASPRRRKLLLLVSLFSNLGILGFFKYFNFFVDSAVVLLESVGFEAHMPVLSIVLPVGISFYTFQTMAYTIDVYRGRMEPTRDPLVFGLYVAFFPQLVAGPIERAQHLIPQFTRPRLADAHMLASGALLILIGLVRKVAIADVVAGEVDAVFANPGALSAPMLVRGVFLFALQIYGDFAGYSDIARGTSRMLGVELMENFNHPYFSTNITVFWRRWHISLSTWLRDYLYIPLGGNRGPTWFVYRNLMLTMLLGGLWHGAAWTFVVWGGIHGLALVIHKLYLRDKKCPDVPRLESAGDWGRAAIAWLITFPIVLLTWVFFRATNLGNAFDVLRGILTLRDITAISPRDLVLPMGMTALLLFIDIPQFLRRDHTVMLSWPWVVRGLVYTGMILLLILIRVEDDVPFIYFQF